MGIINIGSEKFEYKDIHLSYDTISAMDKGIAKELLLKVKCVFDKYGLDFYLAFGTLLGAVRDNNFINGDEDIDIYVWNEDVLVKTIPELYANNVKLCRVCKHKMYSFMYVDGCYIDVYIYRPYRFSLFGLTCYNLNGYAIPKKYFKKTQEIEFLGASFSCSKDPENMLAFLYGKTWNIPLPGSHSNQEIYLSYLYKRLKFYVKSIIKFITGYKYWNKK